MNTQMEIENLILSYLSEGVSEEEAKQVQEWLQASKENRQLFAHHKKLWLECRALAGYEPDKLRQDRKIVDLKIQNSELQQYLKNAGRRFRALACAASVALLAGIFSFWHVKRVDTPVQHDERLLAGGEMEVPYGSKSLMTLPDGSKVWVNAGSKITYPADFGVSSRNVYLTGEAYFDVEKMEDVPFFVNTDLVKIKVYGTAFNVKAYKDDETVETLLDRGAISIIRNDAPDKEISIEPRQKISIRRDSQKIPLPPVSAKTAKVSTMPAKSLEVQEMKNTEVITAWKDNRLVFDQEPLRSLAKQLERRYDVKISFSSDKIKCIRFTAAIKEMPIDQVLEAISTSYPISYRIKGNEIVLMENKNFKIK
jgi:ferric-dicitrate binding protein FerR (iron transport regulator)